MTSSRRAAALALSVLLAVPSGATAQTRRIRGYALNVGTASARSDLSPSSASDLQRLRFMFEPAVGPFELDVAYEHTLIASSRATGVSLVPGTTSGSSDWLGLDWSIASNRHFAWRHRLDRLAVSVPSVDAELTVGRQPISWATTLLLTPADPFAPFDPSDPFREYRAGVDAARLLIFPGPFTEIDVVVREAGRGDTRTTSALARGRTTVASWELSGWAGVLHDQAALSTALQGAVGPWGVRAESAVRWIDSGKAVFRGTVGVDRRMRFSGRDLYVVAEYQRDGFGAGDAESLVAVSRSPPFARGEMQVLGRDAAALQLSWQLHPLVSAQVVNLLNLRDPSALIGPAVGISAADEISLRAGLFLHAGAGGLGETGRPRSEYGALPTFGYVSASLFF